MAPSPRKASDELSDAMDECATLVEKTLERLLPETDLPEAPLYEAMRHGTLAGGKRLRPFLAMQSGKLFNVDTSRSKRVAAAIELLHSYSLIHDDLPSMDNSPMRRGVPSVHKAYGEATAILAGDALLTMAFEVLADQETHDDPRVRIELVHKLSIAAGGHGMVGGQMLDLIGEEKEFDLGTISRLQRMKTGKLMAFACESGAILGRASEPQHRALVNFAYDLGLAFQVTDDVLDVEADPNETGKPANQDDQAAKSTFVSTMGKEQAKSRAEMLINQAKGHLKIFERRGALLSEMADYVLARRA